MSTQGDNEEELEVSSHTLHGLLADLNTPSTASQLSAVQSQSWTFLATSRTQPSTPPAEASVAPPLFPRRVSSRDYSRSVSVPELDLATPSSLAQQTTLFNTPSRSIFSSGPPTSSVSANTAQASMSSPPPVTSSLPLSAIALPNFSTPRRSVHYQDDGIPSSSRKSRIPRAEKDVDDPSSTVEELRSSVNRGSSTPITLNRLFAAPETTTPSMSRHASYVRTSSGTPYTRGIFRLDLKRLWAD